MRHLFWVSCPFWGKMLAAAPDTHSFKLKSGKSCKSNLGSHPDWNSVFSRSTLKPLLRAEALGVLVIQPHLWNQDWSSTQSTEGVPPKGNQGAVIKREEERRRGGKEERRKSGWAPAITNTHPRPQTLLSSTFCWHKLVNWMSERHREWWLLWSNSSVIYFKKCH